MSLLEKIKSLTVGSLSALALITLAVILSISFLVFHQVSDHMQKAVLNPLFDNFDEVQLRAARQAYETSGKDALHKYLLSLDRLFKGRHFLVNASGIDLDSGDDRLALLPAPPATESRSRSHEMWLITHRSEDGRYWFVATGQSSRANVWTFLPYYFIVLGATGVLGWLAWIGVVLPIRRIASTIRAFGAGNLSLRVQSAREDEIGQLGRSFDHMAERLQRLIVNERRLLADISHELRSPLARLKFAVKLARTSPDSEAALDRIERDIDRIASLVADLVEITSIEDDPASQEMSQVALRGVVDELVRDCSLEADAHGCGIEVEGLLSQPLMSNPELLRRALENVLRNAIRYSPRGTTIQMTLSETDRSARIVVRDYGPGVSPSSLGRIFDPFFREEEARVSNGGGSGLGLSIAKRAVLLHRGTIEAENAFPGLRVSIAIPIRASSGA